MRYKTFISHSNFDRNLVTAFYQLLSIYEIDVYIAEYDLKPFELLSNKVTANIKNSDCVIVLLTKNGVKSKYVHNEIGIAIGYGKPIIPIVEKGTAIHDLAVLQGREYIEYNPAYPQEVLLKTSNYVKSLKLNKEQKQNTLLAVGGFISLFLILANGK